VILGEKANLPKPSTSLLVILRFGFIFWRLSVSPSIYQSRCNVSELNDNFYFDELNELAFLSQWTFSSENFLEVCVHWLSFLRNRFCEKTSPMLMPLNGAC
jgi:hypothetical protein